MNNPILLKNLLKMDRTIDIPSVDDIDLKNIQMESTLVTIFEDRVFGKPKVPLDVYHHFGDELEWALQAVMRELRLTH